MWKAAECCSAQHLATSYRVRSWLEKALYLPVQKLMAEQSHPYSQENLKAGDLPSVVSWLRAGRGQETARAAKGATVHPISSTGNAWETQGPTCLGDQGSG